MFSHFTRLGGAFASTIDPQCFFPSHTHAAALRVLSDVPEDGHNVRVLLGGAGMGKTIVLLRLLEEFKSAALTAHLFWTQLAGDQFLGYLLHELGVSQVSENPGQARKLFTGVLQREFGSGRRVIIAIDEAQNLKLPTLRALSEVVDSSLARSKDLEIVFAGLPDLAAKLDSVEAKGLSDRIAAIASLSALTLDETSQYIDHKLKLFGYQGPPPFTPDALTTIAKLAEGIPGNINNVCSAAIYSAEQRASNLIDWGIVLEATEQGTGRLMTQGSTPQSISFISDVATADEMQVSAASQPQVSTPDDATRLAEASSQETVISQEAVALPDNIRRPFAEQALVSSGSGGELGATAGRAPLERGHAFQTALCFYEAVGRTPPASLQRLQQKEQSGTEDAKAAPPEQAADERGSGDAGEDAVTQDVTGHSGDGINGEAHNHEEQTETGLVSPADQALDRLRESSLFDAVDETPSSRLRVVVLAMTIAVVIALGWTYAMTPTGRTYVLHVAGQLARAKTAIRGIVFRGEKPRSLPEGKNASTVSSRKEPFSNDETVPLIGENAQRAAQSEALQETGIQPHTGEISSSFQQAALSGDPNAQFELGTAYALGRGVPADPVIGYTWLTLAFANGDREAESSIRQLTPQLSQSQIARIRWNVAEMYANGVGVQPDKVTGYMWHVLAELAGEKRSMVAKSHLAAAMTSEEQSEASARAMRWLKRHHQR